MKVSDMLRIAHSVSAKIHTTTPYANIESVSNTLKRRGVGALPVLTEGILIGIISERDIVTRVVAEGLNPKHTLVVDVMTPSPVFVSPNHNLEECRNLMENGKFRHLPVLDVNGLVGMISIRDILVALIKKEEDLRRDEETLRSHYESYIYANR